MGAPGEKRSSRIRTWSCATKASSDSWAVSRARLVRSRSSRTSHGCRRSRSWRRISSGRPWARISNCSITSGRKRRWRRPGKGLTTTPPPMVTLGEGWRMIKRSPLTRTTGLASRSWTQPSLPGGRTLSPSSRTRAGVSAAPLKKSTAALCLSEIGASARYWSWQSTSIVGRSQPGAVRTSPRSTSSLLTPVRLTATRLPGTARSIFCLWVWRPRMRALSPEGRISTSCPVTRVPSLSVPVTTVPNPGTVNTLSTGSRGRLMSRRGALFAR